MLVGNLIYFSNKKKIEELACGTMLLSFSYTLFYIRFLSPG